MEAVFAAKLRGTKNVEAAGGIRRHGFRHGFRSGAQADASFLASCPWRCQALESKLAWRPAPDGGHTMSARKRTWKNSRGEKEAWIVDYRDQQGGSPRSLAPRARPAPIRSSPTSSRVGSAYMRTAHRRTITAKSRYSRQRRRSLFHADEQSWVGLHVDRFVSRRSGRVEAVNTTPCFASSWATPRHIHTFARKKDADAPPRCASCRATPAPVACPA